MTDPADTPIEWTKNKLRTEGASELEMAERELITWTLHWQWSATRLLALKLERIREGDSSQYTDIFSDLEKQIQHRLAKVADMAAKVRKIRRL